MSIESTTPWYVRCRLVYALNALWWLTVVAMLVRAAQGSEDARAAVSLVGLRWFVRGIFEWRREAGIA